ncbi:MAG TPA: DUF21 domain-containing protein, partial [Oscillatoriaceae cyanobacterium]
MDPASPYPGIDLLAGLILIAVSVLGVAFFSSSEAAIISLNKLRVRMLAEQGLKSAQRLQRMAQRRDRLVGTILLAENALIVLAATVAGYLALKYFHHASWLAAIASSAAITAVVVLVGEIIPKTFAAQNADRYALLIARPLVWVMRALWPLVWVFTAVARVYVHLFNLLFRTHQELALPLITEQELQMLLADVEQQGVLEQSETEMIRSVI